MTIIDKFKLNNKVAIVTGGYGYLGKYFVETLAEAGAVTIIGGRDLDKCNILKEKIIQKIPGSHVDFIKMDISDSNSIKDCYSKVYTKYKKIDILINNAAYGASNNLEDMTDKEWNYGIDGTLSSVFKCIREIIPYMKKNLSGSIINISSMYGMVSPDLRIYKDNSFQLNPPNYGAAKSGVIQLTKYSAVSLAKYKIRVNCISPGPFPSDNVQKNKKFITQLSNKVPLGRIGQPEELKGALILLASDASSYMTGHNLVVDGGWTIW